MDVDEIRTFKEQGAGSPVRRRVKGMVGEA